VNKLIEEVKSHMKKPRPADLESSLTVMCDYAYKLIDRLEAAEKIIDQLRDHQSIPCTSDPESPPCYLLDSDMIELSLKEYEELK